MSEWPHDMKITADGNYLIPMDEWRAFKRGAAFAQQWQPIETAPTDGTPVLIYASEREGLSAFQCVARYHPDAGWCVCELRHATHWQPLPPPPVSA